MGLILTRIPKETIDIYNEDGSRLGRIELLKVEGNKSYLRFHGFKKNKIMRSELKVSPKIFNNE